MELELEAQKERFVTLVSPENKLLVTPDGFQTVEKIIPALGTVTLCGTNDSDYDDAEFGIAIIKDRTVIEKANSLKDKGLLETFVHIYDRGAQDPPLTCKVVLPEHNLALESIDNPVITSAPEGHPEIRYYSTTYRWTMKGDIRRLVFFAPADPKFLSQLRFSFSQIHNPPNNK